MSHRITIHDIMSNDLDDLMQGEKADLLYVDPPWGSASLSFWRTHNKQKGHAINWEAFLQRIRFIYERHVTGGLCIETGLKFESGIVSVFGHPQGRYDVVYKSGGVLRPSLILIYGALPQKDPTGLNGYDLPYTVISALPHRPRSVLDPCVGLGTTAKVAKALGMTCYANELNPDRAAKTMRILDFQLVGKDVLDRA